MKPLVQELVAVQAERRPAAPAVLFDGSVLSYRDLDALSNQLARILRETGVRRSDRVALLSPNTASAIVAMLAIYKTDGIYVPLPLTTADQQIADVLRRSQATCLLIEASTADLAERVLNRLPAGERPVVGSLDTGLAVRQPAIASFGIADAAAQSSDPLPYANRPGSPAHMLFSFNSGATQAGVVISHANVTRAALRGSRYFEVTPDDRQVSHAPLASDLSFFDIMGTFAAGASLYPVPERFRQSPDALAAFIAEHQLTQWSSDAATLTTLAEVDAAGVHEFPKLKRVMWRGEQPSADVLTYWMTRLRHTRFTAGYGPIEAAGVSSFHTLPSPGAAVEPLPIGKMGPDQSVIVLDDSGRPAGPEQVGEVHIRGGGVSPGYWRDPQATQTAFALRADTDAPVERLYCTGDLARVDADGYIYLIGRRDGRVPRWRARSTGRRRVEIGMVAI